MQSSCHPRREYHKNDHGPPVNSHNCMQSPVWLARTPAPCSGAMRSSCPHQVLEWGSRRWGWQRAPWLSAFPVLWVAHLPSLHSALPWAPRSDFPGIPPPLPNFDLSMYLGHFLWSLLGQWPLLPTLPSGTPRPHSLTHVAERTLSPSLLPSKTTLCQRPIMASAQ